MGDWISRLIASRRTRWAGWTFCACLLALGAGYLSNQDVGRHLGVEPPAPAPVAAMAASPAAPEPEPAQAEVPAQASPFPDLPPYPGSRPQRLADGLLAQGVPMDVSWFSTRDSPARVIAFYEQELRRAGYPAVARKTSAASGFVGYQNPRTHRMHLVSVLAQGGETFVYPSITDPERVPKTGGTVPAGLPHPPDAVGTVVLDLQDGDAVQHTIYATVPGARLDDVLGFYRKAFGAAGWSVEEQRTGGRAARVDASRNHEVATAHLRQGTGPGGEGGVSITLTLVKRS